MSQEPHEEEVTALLHQLAAETEAHAEASRQCAWLAQQIIELQRVNIRLLEERRAVDLHAMVRQFHRKFDMPVKHAPEIPTEAELRWRLTLIAEEFFEMLEACFCASAEDVDQLDVAEMHLREVIQEGDIRQSSFAELVDAWADLKYVIVGSEVTFGVDGSRVFGVVHAANMAKEPGGGHPCKPTKPPGWTPPDIQAELDRQRAEELKRT